MTKANKVKLIFGIVISVLTVVVGVMFIVQAADIYYSADDGAPAYSYETIGQKLKLLVVPVAIWLAAIISGVVLSALYPTAQKKQNKQAARKTVARLAKRLPQDNVPKEFAKWEIVCGVCHIVCLVVCIVAIVLCCVYVFDTANFPAENINAEVLKMLGKVLPWIIAALVVCVADVIADCIIAKKQLTVLKDYIKQNKLVDAPQEESKQTSLPIWIVRGVIVVAAVTFVIVGIFNGSAGDVLTKAINICAECIGLG